MPGDGWVGEWSSRVVELACCVSHGKKWLVDADAPGVVETEAAVMRLIGAGVSGGAFGPIDAGGGLNAATNAAAAVAAAVTSTGRKERFFACSSWRNAMALSSGMSAP